MRLLYFRDDHVRDRIITTESESNAGRSNCVYERKHLQMRHIRSHSGRNQNGIRKKMKKNIVRARDASPIQDLKGRGEIERYELFEDPRYRFELHRRTFLKLVGGGIVFVVPMRSLTAQESGRRDSHND